MAYLTVTETAALLKLKASTVKRHIRCGLIPAQRIGGFNSPWRIDELQLRQSMAGLESIRRDGALFTEHMGKTASEEVQYDELGRRLAKLQRLGMLHLVRPLLDKYGAKQLNDLHPRDYPKFRAGLMRLGIKKGRAAA